MSDSTDSVATPELTSDTAATDAMLDRLQRRVSDVSLAFERWDDPHARGPGLYFIVGGDSVGTFSTPMGTNRWPVEDCASVYADTDVFLATARSVALSCDGAVVVHEDGTIEESMVRVTQLSPADCQRLDELPFADWMGARHMSALETSVRKEVVATITLSEESGRVTVFADGAVDES